MADASARDADPADRPLRLTVESADDLGIVSTLTQDAVARTGEIAWMPRRRRLVILLNRFRWEDRAAAERDRRPYERVRSALLFEGVMSVRGRGVDPRNRRAPLVVIGIGFEPDGECGGRVTLALAGGGEIVLEVECIEARLFDVTRPWIARSRRVPEHDQGDAVEA